MARSPLTVYLPFWEIATDGYNAPRTKRALEAGIRVLENQAIKIERGGNAIWLVGLADEGEGHPDIISTLKQS